MRDKSVNIYNKSLKRGDIVLFNSNGLLGYFCEVSHGVIIQNNIGNKFSPCTIIMVVQNYEGKYVPRDIITTVDKRRILKKVSVFKANNKLDNEILKIMYGCRVS